MYIQPPDDVLGENDQDSGDKDALKFSNLGSCQLLTSSMVEVQDETGPRVIVGSNNEEDKIASTISRKTWQVTILS